MMTAIKCDSEQFQERIIFMSMSNDIACQEKGNRENLSCEFSYGCRLCSNIRARTLVVSWAWIRREMVRNSHMQTEWRMGRCHCGHPVFRGSSDYERGELKSKGKGKLSIYFNGSAETVEVILRTVISVNQFSVYGALPDMCKE